LVSQEHDEPTEQQQSEAGVPNMPLRTAVAQPTPARTETAWNSQFLAHAPHSMQASRSTILALRSSTAKTACGQTTAQRPQPVHFSASNFSVTTFGKYRIFAMTFVS
jgi:hypothetical protein